MPTYEYACTACGHRLEAVQSFTDDPLTECPECGAALRKVYSPVGIVLKGSGFYKTDSRAAAKSNGKSSDATKSDETERRQGTRQERLGFVEGQRGHVEKRGLDHQRGQADHPGQAGHPGRQLQLISRR